MGRRQLVCLVREAAEGGLLVVSLGGQTFITKWVLMMRTLEINNTYRDVLPIVQYRGFTSQRGKTIQENHISLGRTSQLHDTGGKISGSKVAAGVPGRELTNLVPEVYWC